MTSLGRSVRPAASPVQEGAVMGLAALVTYLLTRTRDVGGDDTVFAAAVDAWLGGRGPWDVFFHPHHPLFNPLVAVMSDLARLLGLQPFVLDVGAGASAVFAALSVGGLVVLLRRAEIREGVALLTAATLAACGGLWQFATRMEVYAMAAAAVTAWLLAVGTSRPRPGRVAGALTVSLLSHLATAALLPASIARLGRPVARGVVASALAVAAAAAILAAGLALTGHAPSSWPALVFPDDGAAYIAAPDPLGATHALRDLALWRWYRSTPILRSPWPAVLDLTGTVALILLAALAALGLVGAARRRHPLALAAVGGILGFSPLWLLWDSGNVEHTVAASPLFAVLVGFGADRLRGRLGAVLLAAVLVALVLVNGLGSALPQSRAENSRLWVLAAFVHDTVPADAAILSVGVDGRLRLGLSYLSGRRVIDLTLAVSSAQRQGRTPVEGLAHWLAASRQVPELWTAPDVHAPEGARWAARLGIPGPVWRAAIAPLAPVDRIALETDGVVLERPFVLSRVRHRAGEQPSRPSPAP